MAKLKTFSDYLREAGAKPGTQPRSNFDVSQWSAMAPTKKAEEPQNPLSWFVDILSRPMRAVQGTILATAEETKKRIKSEQTGKPYDVWGGLGHMASAPIRGAFSTNPEDQPSGDKIIENWTDAANMSQDPTYKDTTENVNPWIKGIGGFAIDLGTDPLMFIPGGQVSAGLRGGVAGVKAVSKGIEIASKAAKTAEVAGETAAKAVVASESVTKPFASNVISGFFKGAMSGVPGAEKIGRFSRAMKPIGLSEWKQQRALEKVDKSLKRTGLTLDDITAVASNPKLASELATTSRLSAEQIVAKANKLSRKSPAEGALSKLDRANIWRNRVWARNALPEPNAALIRETAEAMTPAAKAATKASVAVKPLTTGEAIAREVGLVDAKTFADTMLTQAAGTEKINIPISASYRDWFAGHVAKATQDSYKIAHGEYPAIDGTMVKSGFLTAPEIRQINKSLDQGIIKLNDNGFTIINTANGAGTRRLQRLIDKLDNAYEKHITEVGTSAEDLAKVKASRSIMDMITKQPTQAEALLGKEAISVLEGVKTEAAKRNVVQYLSDVLSGVKDTDKARFGKTKREIFTDAVFRHHGQNIGGTEARANQSVERVADEINLEANELSKQGKTLKDAPEFAGMTEDKVQLVARNTSGWLREQFLNLSGYVFRHKNVSKTEKEYMAGQAKFHLQINTPDQVNLYVRMVNDLTKEIDNFNRLARKQRRWGDVISNDRRAARIFQEAIDNLRPTYGWLNSKGITAAMGTGDNVVHLYMDQVLETLAKFAKTTDGRRVISAAIANKNTSVPLSNIIDAIVAKQINPEATMDDIIAILRQNIKVEKGKKPVSNYLNREKLSLDQVTRKNLYWEHIPFGQGRKAPKDSDWLYWVRNDQKEGRGMLGWYGVIKPEAFAKRLANIINDSADDFTKIIRANDEAMVSRITSETHFMTDSAWKYLDSVADDTESLFESLDILANPRKYFEAMEKAGKTMPESMEAAIAITKNRSSIVSQLFAKQATETASRTAKPMAKKRTAKDQAKAERADYANENARYAKAEGDAAREHETSISNDAYGYERTVLDVETAVVGRTMANNFWSKFVKSIGVADILHNFSAVDSFLHLFHGNFKRSLGKTFKRYKNTAPLDAKGTTIMEKGWHDLINNVDAVDTRAFRNEIKEMLEGIIGVKGNRVETSLFGGASPDMVQAYLYRSRLDIEIPMDDVQRWAESDGTSMTQAMLEHFEDWIGMTNNPIDVLEKLNFAASSLLAHQGAAKSFIKIPGATKSVETPGYSKVSSEINPVNNPLMAHLPENTYVHDDLVQQIRNMERIMSEKRTPSGNIGDFLNNTYLPILGAWKYLVTVIRPGHHLRNFVSSESIQVMDQGFKNYRKSFAAAAKTLAALRKYEVADFAGMLKQLDVLKMPQSGDVLFTHPRFGPITTDMINEVAAKNGLYTPVVFSEDLLAESSTGAINKIARTLTARDTKLEDIATGASRLQNDINRVHHLIQYMMNNGNSSVFKSWDDLAQTASEHVRRAQPDGSMLTGWEARNMRLLFPFYAWTRMVTPVIFDLIMNQPGRFMILPKASYNLAVATGVNPESLQDPFPTDQLFPAYLRDRLTGPVLDVGGKYYNILPGFATNDIVNQFVGNPAGEIPTQLSPFLRVPAELLSGSRWGSQSKIKDLSDYIDSQIPLVNYVSNISGTSVTGSIPSVLQGQGFDQQYQFLKDNKDATDQAISFTNWLSGMGLTNYSNPASINLAEIEKRNREARRNNQTPNPF